MDGYHYFIHDPTPLPIVSLKLLTTDGTLGEKWISDGKPQLSDLVSEDLTQTHFDICLSF